MYIYIYTYTYSFTYIHIYNIYIYVLYTYIWHPRTHTHTNIFTTSVADTIAQALLFDTIIATNRLVGRDSRRAVIGYATNSPRQIPIDWFSVSSIAALPRSTAMNIYFLCSLRGPYISIYIYIYIYAYIYISIYLYMYIYIDI